MERRRRRLRASTSSSVSVIDLLPLLFLAAATAVSSVAAVNAEPAAAVVDVDDLLASVRAAAATAAGNTPLSPAAAATAGRTAMGNACGPGIGKCSLAGEGGGGCCNNRGTCSFECSAGLCQPEFSLPGFCGVGPPWDAPPKASSLPLVSLGSPCGTFVARCEDQSCCGSLGFCVASRSPLCGSDIGEEEGPVRTTRRFRVVATRGDVDALGGFNSSSNSGLPSLRRPGGILVNGRGSPSSPAPLALDAEVGDNVVVEFVNALEETTSVHFHGVRWRARASQDGTAGVTQRAIVAGGSESSVPIPAPPVFVYDFVAGEAGTFWWHAHVRALAADGLRGTLVVRRGNERNRQRQPEATLFVADFYSTGADDTLAAYLSDANTGGKEPTPDALTINGRSWWWERKSDGAGGNSSAAPPPPSSSLPPPAVQVVTRSVSSSSLARCSAPKEQHALVRVVNGGIFATVAVHFEAAAAATTATKGSSSSPTPPPPRIRATVVAADAVPTAPTVVSRDGRPLRLGVGQRHDVELCVEGNDPSSRSDSDVRLAWAVAVADGALFDAPMRVSNVTAALLRFGGGKSDGEEDDLSLVAPPTKEVDLSDAGVRAPAPPAFSFPSGSQSGPSTATHPPSPLPTMTHDLVISFGSNNGTKGGNGGSGGGGPSYFVSGVSQRPQGLDDPSKPSFLEREVMRRGGGGGDGERGDKTDDSSHGSSFHVLRHSLGDVVEMRLRNDDDVDHAWHLHGHNFWVVPNGSEDEEGGARTTTRAKISEARDVVLVPHRSTVVARYVADSPGAFLAHCHQGWHHEAGLGVLMEDGIRGERDERKTK